MLQHWGIGFSDNMAQFRDHYTTNQHPHTPTHPHPQYRVSTNWLYT